MKIVITPKERSFILELTELTKKHGIAINGCGCCGSPSLDEIENIGLNDGYTVDGSADLEWIAETSPYYKGDTSKVIR